MLRVRRVGGRSTPTKCGRPRSRDKVLRTAIEAHGGFLFKHTGDGVCAAFGSPRSAVDAAVAAPSALELSVRMGIATGEAELRDGDYSGTVLNRGTRVMAAGHGGQILLADSTARTAERSRPGGSGSRVGSGPTESDHAVPGQSAGPARAVSAVAGTRYKIWEPAPRSDQFHRARVRDRRSSSGGAFTSARDVDRRRWRRQDAPCGGSRDAVGRRICRRGMGFRACRAG